MTGDNNYILKKGSQIGVTCALCGTISKNSSPIEVTIYGDRHLFDSQNCISIFRKLANLYGQEFKSISVGEQYVYDSNLKTYVRREHELDTINNEKQKIENQTFQIIRPRRGSRTCV